MSGALARQQRDPALIGYARRLRANLTPAEARLWKALSGRKLAGAKFSRQINVTGYICDFVCREHRLVVELDGSQHLDSEADRVRDGRLAASGSRVLRFWNTEVLESPLSIDHVLARIAEHLPLPGAHPRPLPTGRGE